jgi:two-component system, NtrC family, sensor kinase
MKIHTKVIGLLILLFALLGGAAYVVQLRVLLPSFTELEREAARTDMERVVQAVSRELHMISVSAGDYGNWIDTYQFMQDHDPSYIDINLTPESIEALNVNLIALLDPEGRIVHSQAQALDSAEPLDLNLSWQGVMPASHPWFAAVREGRVVRGLLWTSHGPLLAAMSPVLNGQGEGPHRGMVMLGRLLTAAEAARIGQQAQVKIVMTPLTDPGIEARDTLPPESAADATGALIEREHVTEVYQVFKSVTGRPVMTLRIDVPRTISARGRETVNFASAFLALAAIVVLTALIAMLRRSVLNPIHLVTRHAIAMGRADDMTVRLNLERKDEIGTLAREFDHMVEALAAARRKLVDQSFDAGAAESASGVLHNIGNAMTPLSVQLSTLKSLLRAAPAADVELVIAELDGAGADPARQADLQQFLCLVSRELAKVVGDAEAGVDAVTQHGQAIQRMLTEQSRTSRAGPVVEATRLDELVEHSAELIPPDLRRCLQIEADVSLRELGTVCVARTTVQQVFQNLVINAAEAVRATGRERGVLRVASSITSGPAGESVHLQFTDDGVGIVAEHLGRVFEKGFSTKSRDTNSGIGLHWSANAVNALGGSLRAESAGAGCGACMHLVLPLHRPQTVELTKAA